MQLQWGDICATSLPLYTHELTRSLARGLCLHAHCGSSCFFFNRIKRAVKPQAVNIPNKFLLPLLLRASLRLHTEKPSNREAVIPLPRGSTKAATASSSPSLPRHPTRLFPPHEPLIGGGSSHGFTLSGPSLQRPPAPSHQSPQVLAPCLLRYQQALEAQERRLATLPRLLNNFAAVITCAEGHGVRFGTRSFFGWSGSTSLRKQNMLQERKDFHNRTA